MRGVLLKDTLLEARLNQATLFFFLFFIFIFYSLNRRESFAASLTLANAVVDGTVRCSFPA